jgi:hypothetical protein
MAQVVPKSVLFSESGTSTPSLLSSNGDDLKKVEVSVTALSQNPPLGNPKHEKRFWFQRGKSYDPDAIATQVGFSLIK